MSLRPSLPGHPRPDRGLCARPSRDEHSEPISMRNWTDLDAECDRSRAGTGPISRESLAGTAEHHSGTPQRANHSGASQRSNGGGALRGELHRGRAYRNRTLMPYSRLRCPGEGRAVARIRDRRGGAGRCCALSRHAGPPDRGAPPPLRPPRGAAPP